MIFQRAVIVGHAGQDGQILISQLLSSGCEVLGIGRQEMTRFPSHPNKTAFDPFDKAAVKRALKEFRPQAIFFLAAYHNASEDPLEAPATLIEKTYAVSERLLTIFLEAMRLEAPECRFVFAASSHIFMKSNDSPQVETSVFAPDSIYGYAKLNALYLTRHYREQTGIHASTAILYNHESELRSPKFIPAKLMQAALRAKADRTYRLEIGSFSAQADWGYAYDYCDAMVRMASHPRPGEYIVATGQLHSVEDLARIAFGNAGLDYRDFVYEKSQPFRNVSARLTGDATKLRKETGWHPTVTFEEMISRIMDKLAVMNLN